jgi:mannose-1-phosphate guanylyltransferase/mannose-6-phosphate isomerase
MKIVWAAELKFIPASHEDPESPGVFKKVMFRKDDLVDGKAEMINWALLPKGRSFAPHYHEDMQEVFIIVRGKAKITIDEETGFLNQGDAVVIPVGSVHEMENIGTEDVEYVVVGISEGAGGKTVVL